jgi:hypothetical protein
MGFLIDRENGVAYESTKKSRQNAYFGSNICGIRTNL